MDAKQEAESNRQIKVVKDHMPRVYQAIREAAEVRGAGFYNLVRRGMWGEPNCFYAFEGGRVVGTPFEGPVSDEVAAQIVQFGAAFVMMLAPAKDSGGADGTH